MRNLFLASLTLSLTVVLGAAQVPIDCSNSCSYFGEEMPSETYGFDSDSEAETALQNIMSATGLPINFKLMAGNVPNAAAIIRCDEHSGNCDRYIIYNQTFMLRVEEQTKTDWAAISILAHEIGHHLSGHTLLQGGSRPRLELEADKFSGFVLYNLGATLEEALIAIKTFVGEQGSSTHPGRSARVAAITNGWIQASEINPSKEEKAREKAASKPITTNASVPDQGVYWRYDGAKNEYALYVDGQQIANRCEKSYSGNDYLVYDPQARKTYLLENFRNLSDNQIRPGRILGGGANVFWRHNGAARTYVLYANGDMISNRCVHSYSNNHYIVYDPQTKVTYFLENFKTRTGNQLYPGQVLGTGSSIFFRFDQVQNVYALYVDGDHISSRCRAAYSDNDYLIYDPETRSTYICRDFKNNGDNTLRKAALLGRGSSIYWRHNGTKNTYALYVEGEQISQRCEARYEGDDYLVYDPEEGNTYLLEGFRNRKDNKLRLGKIR